jgi:hypothetical protein
VLAPRSNTVSASNRDRIEVSIVWSVFRTPLF